jgi:hypothetical protein
MLFFRKKKVQCLGRSGIKYRAHGKSLRIDSEFTSDPLGVVIYDKAEWTWDEPHSNLRITPEEKTAIMSEVEEHFLKRGYSVEIHR